MRALLLGIFVLVPAQVEAQRTLHIPADYLTIQAGIDAATPGDTVLVAPGTWLENLDFHGKAITVQSAEGPALTILDGRRLAPTVSFTTGETRASVLSGFTLRHGAPAPALPGQAAPHGAGALLTGSSPTLTGNLFTENLCAALDATAAAPLLADNRFTRTQPDSTCLAQAVAPLTFTGSPATGSLVATLLHNTVESNDLTGSATQPNAGAIALLGARALLQGNTLRFNIVSGDAPALQILTSPGLGTPTLLQENLLYGNTSQCGPALLVQVLNDPATTVQPHLEVEVLGNTLADDTLSSSCPAANLAAEFTVAAGTLPAQILVANNIFAAASSYPAFACTQPLAPDAFHHNLIHNLNGPFLSPVCADAGANLFNDPLFADRPAGDYHLSLRSTAVDAGANAVAPRPARDLDNALRLQNATGRPTAVVDLGAFEYPGPRSALAPTTTVLNLAPFPGQAFQATTLSAQVTTSAGSVPAGTVLFSASGQTLATVALDSTGRAAFTTTSLTAARWTVFATFSGSPTLEPSTSAPMAQTVAPAATLLAFSLTPSVAAVSQAVTLSAHVSAPLSTRIPTGAVQFFELPASGAPIPLGGPALDPAGNAAFSLATLVEGTHRIMAAYPGDPNFAPVTLPAADALTLTISARGYLQALATPTLTVATTHHAPITLTLTSLGNFADSLALSCANLPPSATCSFAPASATLSAGARAAIVLTVDTDAIPGFAKSSPPTLLPDLGSGSRMAFAGLFSLGLLLARRSTRRDRARLGLFSILLVAATFLGCGAGQYPAHTPPGTYQIDVISQATATGQSQTTPLTLVVTP